MINNVCGGNINYKFLSGGAKIIFLHSKKQKKWEFFTQPIFHI